MNRIPFLRKKKVEGMFRSTFRRKFDCFLFFSSQETSRQIRANDPEFNATKQFAVNIVCLSAIDRTY